MPGQQEHGYNQDQKRLKWYLAPGGNRKPVQGFSEAQLDPVQNQGGRNHEQDGRHGKGLKVAVEECNKKAQPRLRRHTERHQGEAQKAPERQPLGPFPWRGDHGQGFGGANHVDYPFRENHQSNEYAPDQKLSLEPMPDAAEHHDHHGRNQHGQQVSCPGEPSRHGPGDGKKDELTKPLAQRNVPPCPGIGNGAGKEREAEIQNAIAKG